jgi:DNA-directed RNA polymerase subunit RPC12/RpoP
MEIMMELALTFQKVKGSEDRNLLSDSLIVCNTCRFRILTDPVSRLMILNC